MRKIFDEKTKINLIAMIKNYSDRLDDIDIAQRCGVSSITVYRWKKKLESFNSLIQISKHYDVNYRKLCKAVREKEYEKNRNKYLSNPIKKEPTYTWPEVVEIIYKKYNILLGD